MIRLVSAVALGAALLGCSSAVATGAPPPPPRRGLSAAPPTVGAEPPAEKKPCGCSLKLDPAQAPPSAPPPQPLPPISGDLPQGPFDLERRSACTAPVCRLDGFVPDAAFLQTTREGAPSEGAVWLETIADKSVVQTPASDEIDALALVLEGTVAYGEGDPKKAPASAVLGPWGALRAQNAGYFLQARGGRASVLMVVTARGVPLAEAVQRAQRDRKSQPASGRRLEARDLSTVAKFSWGGGAYHARIAFGGAGADKPPASLTLIQASGQGSIPENVHEQEWEHIAILRGSGEMLLGNAKYPVQNGSVFHVPEGAIHGWNGSGQELAAVLVFSPSGPEQRFVQLGAK